MITEKLNRFIYELEYRDYLAMDALSLDEIVQKMLDANPSERQKILDCLRGDIKEKIQTMIEGGLL